MGSLIDLASVNGLVEIAYCEEYKHRLQAYFPPVQTLFRSIGRIDKICVRSGLCRLPCEYLHDCHSIHAVFRSVEGATSLRPRVARGYSMQYRWMARQTIILHTVHEPNSHI